METLIVLQIQGALYMMLPYKHFPELTVNTNSNEGCK
jgi:hypothetical protein